MCTQCSVYILEVAFPYKAALGAAHFTAFFARCTVDAHFTACFIDDVLERCACECRSCAEEIMPAAVAEAGQCVIFCEEDQDRSRLP